MVQAYIFSVLAAVYIAAATSRAPRRRRPTPPRVNRRNPPRRSQHGQFTIIAVASIVTAGITTGFGTMGPALAEGRAVATALTALAQQPDASSTITRTLFVGLAMIESRPSTASSSR